MRQAVEPPIEYDRRVIAESHRPRASRRRTGLTLVVGLAACAPRGASPTVHEDSAGSPAPAPAEFVRELQPGPTPTITCTGPRGHARLLTLDWTQTERDALVRALDEGLAVVRHEGCELVLLPDCHVRDGRYTYTARAPLEYRVTIEPDPVSRIVNLPRLAAVQPTSSSPVTAEIVTAGHYRAAAIDLRRAGLMGECAGATHAVGAIEVGSILSTSLDPKARGSVCRESHPGDSRPPPRCDMPWSVQLIPLDPFTPWDTPCPAPLRWNGFHCARDSAPLASATCTVARTGHPACDDGWPPLPPGDPRDELLPDRLTQAMIDMAVAPVREAVTRCAGELGEAAGTRVRLHVVVDGHTGRVREARASGSQAGTALGRCAVQAIAEARFETTRMSAQAIDLTLTTS